MAGSFDIDVEEVIIFNLLEGVFYAKLICNNGEKRMEIDARTSDAIAIAVRFGCPIYTYEFILSTAGIIVDESAEGGEEQQVVEKPAVTTTKLSEGELSAASTDELNEMLTKALEEEAYERASRIRDELNKRKSN